MGFFGFKTRRGRAWEEVRGQAQEDLVALGEDIRGLDLDVQMPNASPEAKQRYEQALEAYQRASSIFDRARQPEDLAPMSQTLEEGRFAMSCAKALLEGRPVPERRPPCFFDPRHGPSVEEVQWSPPGGAPRDVPACAADALRIKEGFDPHSRQVLVDGRPTAYWNAPRHYAPWAGGYFQGFGGGGLLGSLFTGAALGAGFGLGEELVGDMFGGGGWGNDWDDRGGDWDDGGYNDDSGYGDGGDSGGGFFDDVGSSFDDVGGGFDGGDW